ncbi:hypothetical protein ACK8HX_08605 [Oryzobacter sp. R7]|uniref:hypothetical protein n=1 Tax=Oryzobacter faecalis TaxID=3388656 RepID=UPI00398D1DB4
MPDPRSDADEPDSPDETTDLDGPAEPAEAEAPRLEIAAVAVLVASVLLAVIPATEPVAPAGWVAGMVMVLLSRRWGPGDKGLSLLAYGILGVPFVVLGRDELRAPASIVTGIVLVALWGTTAAWLLRRARSGRVEGRGLRMR